MKRPMPWKNDAVSSSSEDSNDSSSSDSQSESDSDVKAIKRKGGALDFEALNRHGYRGGLSVLKVPPPKEEHKNDWSWSTGEDSKEVKETEESMEERQKTKAALAEGEELRNVQTRKEKERDKEKNRSFSQKEKRKRDLGQASRGKNYVEEEKRLLRENGVYSGFDS